MDMIEKVVFRPKVKYAMKPMFFISLVLLGPSAFVVCFAPYPITSWELWTTPFMAVCILLGIALIFSSFKITISNSTILFYMYFICVKKISFVDIHEVIYEPISRSGQRCALTVTMYDNSQYSYPIRLFGSEQMKEIIRIIQYSTVASNSLNAANQMVFSVNRINANFFRYILWIAVLAVILMVRFLAVK